MRFLTREEIDVALDDNGESGEGCVAVEMTLRELGERGAGTSCGFSGNVAFLALGLFFRGCDEEDKTRRVRGWWYESGNVMCGMIHIECDSDEMAEEIREVAYMAGAGGSLRPDGKSLWGGFYEFESE
jgi:hypothetical protein